MNGLLEAVETNHGLPCQSLKTLVFSKYRLSVEMLYQETSSKIHDFRKYSCAGSLVKLGECCGLWDDPNQRSNLAAKRLRISSRMDLDLAERMKKLLKGVP